MHSNGEIAYNGYCAPLGGTSLITGAPLPLFSEARDEIRAAWEAAAANVIAHGIFPRGIESVLREHPYGDGSYRP